MADARASFLRSRPWRVPPGDSRPGFWTACTCKAISLKERSPRPVAGISFPTAGLTEVMEVRRACWRRRAQNRIFWRWNSSPALNAGGWRRRCAMRRRGRVFSWLRDAPVAKGQNPSDSSSAGMNGGSPAKPPSRLSPPSRSAPQILSLMLGLRSFSATTVRSAL